MAAEHLRILANKPEVRLLGIHSRSTARANGLAKPLQPESLAAIPHPIPTLNIVIDLENKEGLSRFQVPLRHWNHRSNPCSWQIETGPVLWPLELKAFTTDPNTSWLTPAWIHYNQEGRVTMSGEHLPCHELEAQLFLLVLA